MRKPIIAGNWKMNGTRKSVEALSASLKDGLAAHAAVEVLVFPSFVHIALVQSLLNHSSIHWGGQNLYLGAAGAFTGEVSGPMLVDFGCQTVLVGHSERRAVFKEDLNLVALKFKAGQEHGLQPMLCIGETLEQREKGQTEAVLKSQLQSVLDLVGIEAFRQAVVAYEPVWAIGTGKTATPEQAQETHAFIRHYFTKQNLDVGNTLRILYGGSVKADNASGLFNMPDIDGALVGGASLDAAGFLAICNAYPIDK